MKKYLLVIFLILGLAVSGQTSIHKVTRGETIYTIARLYGTTPTRIADINNFDVATVKLEVDQKIVIPSKYYEVKKPNNAPKFKVYIIKPGDSYYSIARDHSLSVYDVTKINKIKGNTIPKVGSAIMIPVKENETQQISMQEVKINVQQGDLKEREKLDEINFEAKEYYYVKNTPYKRAKLISDYKELPIQIFYHAEVKIDTGKVKKAKRSKKELADSAFLAELKEANVTQSSASLVSDSMKVSSITDTASISTSEPMTAHSDSSQNTASAVSMQVTDTNGNDIVKLTTMLAEDSLNADLYFQRATAHEQNKDYTLSLLDIDKAIVINPENANYYLFRANVFAKLNENKKAIEDLQNAEDKGIDKKEVYMKMALIYEKEGDYMMAINYYEKEIEFNPNSGIAYYLKALAFKQLNQSDNACNSLKKAVEFNFEMAKEEMKKMGCKE